jgi:parvulin-like peptidyl-prolyl isomerase
MSALKILTISTLSLALGGCSWFSSDQSTSRQIGAEAFYRPIPGAEDRHNAPADRGGAIPNAYLTPAPSAPEPPVARAPVTLTRSAATIPSQESAVAESPATQPGAAVLPAPAQLASGQYLTLGALVCEVSGTPIYADKVVRDLTPALATEAKQRGPEDFRAFAVSQIRKQVTNMVQTEVLYTAAVKNLTAEDRDRAWNATMMWRDQQTRSTGGSIELARLKAQQEGLNFDEMVQEQYRRYMVILFQTKKLYPKVAVTADEMRHYYETNLKTQFTETDQAQFRVIVVMASKTGDSNMTARERRDAAAAKIKQIRESLLNGSDADFAKEASQVNDDPVLMKNAGHVGDSDGWMPRESYRVKDVEQAVWKLQPGQITDVIQVNDSYYIARLSDRKLGRVRPFEDIDVQAEILEAIRRPQLAEAQNKFIEQLQKDAVVFPAEPRVEPIFDMVMQKYPQWAAAK